MSLAISPFQQPSVRASFALNAILVTTLFLAFSPLETNASKSIYCIQRSAVVWVPDIAQSGKVRPTSVGYEMKIPASIVRTSTERRSAQLADRHVNFIRCVPGASGLAG